MPSSSEPATPSGSIHGRGLSRHFELRDQTARSLKEVLITRRRVARRELWALRDVDIDVRPGESFGIVGQNGSGKSTLLKLIAGIYPPSSGELHVEGRIGSLLEVGAGFHPDFSGRENVYLNAAVFGISRDYIDDHMDEIIAFAELEEFADQAVKTYSSGMYLRLGFSVAMHINPDILLLDEVLAVGDEAFQRKCEGRIAEQIAAGATLVLVSHDSALIERTCERLIVLDGGEKIFDGPVGDGMPFYHRLMGTSDEAAAPVPSEPPGERV
ncbi:MAG: type transport system ATP-binding protein [Solirubrobacteraceae bacterium]|nr:type transport system ATP-binding protein [Solirubrobacteraceae bacterium]